MPFVILNSQGKRIKKKGTITPVFEFPIQAQRYIENQLAGSEFAKIKKVGK